VAKLPVAKATKAGARRRTSFRFYARRKEEGSRATKGGQLYDCCGERLIIFLFSFILRAIFGLQALATGNFMLTSILIFFASFQ
jgi:hypothetical protein